MGESTKFLDRRESGSRDMKFSFLCSAASPWVASKTAYLGKAPEEQG